MERIIRKKQVAETISSKGTRQKSITERTYIQKTRATEALPSQSPPDAASERILSQKDNPIKKDKYAVKNPDTQNQYLKHRRSGQGWPSSRPRSPSTGQIGLPKKEIFVMSKSAEGSSNLGKNKRTSLKGGSFIGSQVTINNKGGTVIYKSDGVRISGHNKNDDSDSHPQE